MTACSGSPSVAPIPEAVSLASSPGQYLYVANYGAGYIRQARPEDLAARRQQRRLLDQSSSASITVYPAAASGNVAPLRTIAGPNTLLSMPNQLAEDSAGYLYVADESSGILVFAPGANGDATPVRQIAGAAQTDVTTGVAVDGAGTMYVGVCCTNPEGQGDVLRYALNASGNVTPQAVVASGDVWNLTMDTTSGLLIVGHQACCASTATEGVGVFKPTPGGLVSVASIGLLSPEGIVADPASGTYLVVANGFDTNGSAIVRFAETASGSFPYDGYTSGLPTVISALNVSACATALANDGNGSIYLGITPGCSTTPSSVAVYGLAATGMASPRRLIAGPNTGLDNPSGLVVGR